MTLVSLSPLHLRNLRKQKLVEEIAGRGVAYVCFDPRADGASMPPSCQGQPMSTVRLSHGFREDLVLSDWGFEQRLLFAKRQRWTCRAPWDAVYVVSPVADIAHEDAALFPEDAPPDTPLGESREVV